MLGRLVLVVLLLIPSAEAATIILTAHNITATRGVTDASLAFGEFDDLVAAIGEWKTTGDTATMTIENVTRNGTLDNVTFAVRMNASSADDDLLDIQYSNDSGVTWFTADSTVPVNETLMTFGNYSVFQSFPTWGTLNDTLVRLLYTKVQNPDKVMSYLDGVEVYVTHTPPDTTGPNVTLVAPDNGTFVSTASFNVTFNVSDDRGLQNCSVYVNGTLNATNRTALQNGTRNNITLTLPDGSWLWNVTCYDTADNPGTADTAWIVRADTTAPDVNLVSPQNESNLSTQDVTFTYNVTDAASVENCTLVLNGSVNGTNTTITKDTSQTFTRVLENGDYTWYVNCTDGNGHTGQSQVFSLSVRFHFPNITDMLTSGTAVLNAGTTKTVECNFTASDGNGQDDIVSANATFHHDTVGPVTADDNATHYTNGSCEFMPLDADSKRFTCTVQLQYYARNGTWWCNATVLGVDGTVSNATNLSVDPLYAINVSSTTIDFGSLVAGSESADVQEELANVGNVDINVTVTGYGSVPGDGKAFVCRMEDIGIAATRFALTGGVVYSAKRALAAELLPMNLTIRPQSGPEGSTNDTFWQTGLPVNLSDTGLCNGTIVFHTQ